MPEYPYPPEKEKKSKPERLNIEETIRELESLKQRLLQEKGDPTIIRPIEFIIETLREKIKREEIKREEIKKELKPEEQSRSW